MNFKKKILNSIFQRRKYKFEWKNILYLIFWFPKWVWKCRQKSMMSERIKTIECGESKINKEFDIHFIVDSIRKANTLASVLLSKQQLILWKYNSNNLIFPENKVNSNLVLSKTIPHQVKDDSMEDDLKDNK